MDWEENDWPLSSSSTAVTADSDDGASCCCHSSSHWSGQRISTCPHPNFGKQPKKRSLAKLGWGGVLLSNCNESCLWHEVECLGVLQSQHAILKPQSPSECSISNLDLNLHALTIGGLGVSRLLGHWQWDCSWKGPETRPV